MTPFGPVKKCKKVIRRRKARCARAFVLPQVSDAGGAAAGQEEEEEVGEMIRRQRPGEQKKGRRGCKESRRGTLMI